MTGIKNLFKLLTSSLEIIIFKSLKIKSIKNKEIYMAGWYYAFLLALYSFYFILKGKAESEHFVTAMYAVIVFVCMVFIGLKVGIRGDAILNLDDGRLTYYFNLNKEEALKTAKLIQKGLGENIIEDENGIYLEIIKILKTEQEIKE